MLVDRPLADYRPVAGAAPVYRQPGEKSIKPNGSGRVGGKGRFICLTISRVGTGVLLFAKLHVTNPEVVVIMNHSAGLNGY